MFHQVILLIWTLIKFKHNRTLHMGYEVFCNDAIMDTTNVEFVKINIVYPTKAFFHLLTQMFSGEINII